jgi:hypothetical protein
MVSSSVFSLSRPCIRSFVDRALSVGKRQTIEGLVAVHGHLGGGFGNNFIEIISMIQFSIVCGIREIFVDENFLLLGLGTTFRTLQDIQITTIVSNAHIPYPSEKWIDVGWLDVNCGCPDVTWRYVADSIRFALLQTLPYIPADHDTLFLYMRGGAEIWGALVGFSPG